MTTSELSDVNQTLKGALAVARTRPREALDILQAGLEKARGLGDERGVSTLAKPAGAICTELGDLSGAINYYEEARRADPEDAYLHLVVAGIRQRLGQGDEARAAFMRSAELAAKQGDLDVVDLAHKALTELENEVNDGSEAT